MIRRNLIKTAIGAGLLPFCNVFGANSAGNTSKVGEFEDIAAKIESWLRKTGSKIQISHKDTYQLINAIHNNDEIYAFRVFGKTFCIILLAAYQSIVEGKRVLIIGETTRAHERVEKELVKFGFMNDRIIFPLRAGKYTSINFGYGVDVCYCEEIPNRELYFNSLKDRDFIKSLKKVMGREDKLEITVVKNSIKKSYAPSLELERIVKGAMGKFGHKVEVSDFPRWC